MPHFHSSLSFLAYYNACFILGLLLLLFYDPSRSTTHGSVLRADALMFRRKLKDVEIAANLYEEELRKAPEDSALELKLADALNTIMRIKTHSNTLLIEGLLDTPQNKRLVAACCYVVMLLCCCFVICSSITLPLAIEK